MTSSNTPTLPPPPAEFVGVIAANSIVTYTGISSTPRAPGPRKLIHLPQYQNQTTQIALSWDDNSTAEANYTVERSTDGNTWSVITSTLGINTMSYVNTGRTENILYYYRVKATNGAASSPSPTSSPAERSSPLPGALGHGVPIPVA